MTSRKLRLLSGVFTLTCLLSTPALYAANTSSLDNMIYRCEYNTCFAAAPLSRACCVRKHCQAKMDAAQFEVQEAVTEQEDLIDPAKRYFTAALLTEYQTFSAEQHTAADNFTSNFITKMNNYCKEDAVGNQTLSGSFEALYEDVYTLVTPRGYQRIMQKRYADFCHAKIYPQMHAQIAGMGDIYSRMFSALNTCVADGVCSPALSPISKFSINSSGLWPGYTPFNCNDLPKHAYRLQNTQRLVQYFGAVDALITASKTYHQQVEQTREKLNTYKALCESSDCTQLNALLSAAVLEAQSAFDTATAAVEAAITDQVASLPTSIGFDSAPTATSILTSMKNALVLPTQIVADADALKRAVIAYQTHQPLFDDAATLNDRASKVPFEQVSTELTVICEGHVHTDSALCGQVLTGIAQSKTDLTDKLAEVKAGLQGVLAGTATATETNAKISAADEIIDNFGSSVGTQIAAQFADQVAGKIDSIFSKLQAQAPAFANMADQRMSMCLYEPGAVAANAVCKSTFDEEFRQVQTMLGVAYADLSSISLDGLSCSATNTICGKIKQLQNLKAGLPNDCSPLSADYASCKVAVEQTLISADSLVGAADELIADINRVVAKFDTQVGLAKQYASAQAAEAGAARLAEANAVLAAVVSDYQTPAQAVLDALPGYDKTALCAEESSATTCQQHFELFKKRAQSLVNAITQKADSIRAGLPSAGGCGEILDPTARGSCQATEDNKLATIRQLKDAMAAEFTQLEQYDGVLKGRHENYSALAAQATTNQAVTYLTTSEETVAGLVESKAAHVAKVDDLAAYASEQRRLTRETHAIETAKTPTFEGVDASVTIAGSQPVVEGNYKDWADKQLKLADTTYKEIEDLKDKSCKVVDEAKQALCEQEFGVYLEAADAEIKRIEQAKARIDAASDLTISDQGPIQQSVIQISQATLALYLQQYAQPLAETYGAVGAAERARKLADGEASEETAAQLALAAAEAATQASQGPRQMPPIRRFDIHNCTRSSEYAEKTWCGYIQRGAHFSTGNTDSMNFGMDAAIARRDGDWEFGAVGDFDYVKRQGKVIDENYWVGAKVKYHYSDDDSVYNETSYESTALQGYTYIIANTLGIEHRMQLENNINMVLGGGLGMRYSKTTEALIQTDFTQDLRAQIAWMISEWANLDQYFTANIGNFGAHLTVLGSTTSLTTRLSDRLSMVYSFALSHRSEVPSGTRSLEHNGKVGLRYNF